MGEKRIRRVLVTGGSGRVGRYVADELEASVSVRIMDQIKCDDERFEFIEGDITNMRDAEKATAGVDAVIHLAAIPTETGEAEKLFRVNVGGTFNMLEASARNGVKAFVFASSVCAYGFIRWARRIVPPYFPVDEAVPLFSDYTYGMGKVMGETLCHGYNVRYGMDVICLRIATVTFPGNPLWLGVIDDIDNPEHELRPGFSLPEFIWQYVHPKDLAQAFRLAISRLNQGNVGFEAYNIGANDVFSAVPSLELIRRYYPETAVLKRPESFITNEHKTLYGIDKAQEILGYNPQFTWRDLVD